MRVTIIAAISILASSAAAQVTSMPSGPHRSSQMTTDQKNYWKCRSLHAACIAATTDSITKTRTRFVVLGATEPFRLDYVLNEATLLIPCNEGQKLAFLRLDHIFSYGDINIEYRVDPSAKVSTAIVARHIAGGNMFEIENPSALIEDASKGGSMTLRAWRRGDNSAFVVHFTLTGFSKAITALDCR